MSDQSATGEAQAPSEEVQKSSEAQTASEEVQGSSEEVKGSSEEVKGYSEQVHGTSEVHESSGVHGAPEAVQGGSENVQGISKVQGDSENVRVASEDVQGASESVQGGVATEVVTEKEESPANNEVLFPLLGLKLMVDDRLPPTKLHAMLRAIARNDFKEAERELAEMTVRLLKDAECLCSADVLLMERLIISPCPGTTAPFVTETLRCLRNMTGVNASHRAYVSRRIALLNRCTRIVHVRCNMIKGKDLSEAGVDQDSAGGSQVRRGDPAEVALSARVCIQLLGNVVSTEASARPLVWSAVRDLLTTLLPSDDLKLASYSPMLLFNLLKDKCIAHELLGLKSGRIIIDHLMTLITETENEWALFSVESLLSVGGLHSTYPKMAYVHHGAYFDLVLSAVERRRVHLPIQDFMFLRETLLVLATPLLSLDGAGLMQMNAIQVRKLFEMLAVVTADDRYPQELIRKELQAHTAVLDMVVNLLRLVHEIGKDTHGMFSALNKLADMKISGNDEVARQPSFGLKALLVRLTGNLVYRYPPAQRRARELYVIPVILECCNLDARNPLLQQWAIVAVRHMCENCPENQSVIADLALQGMAPAAMEELRRLGVTTVREAGRIRVVPGPRPPPSPPSPAP